MIGLGGCGCCWLYQRGQDLRVGVDDVVRCAGAGNLAATGFQVNCQYCLVIGVPVISEFLPCLDGQRDIDLDGDTWIQLVAAEGNGVVIV